MTAIGPAARPCGSCPYRCDVPSGVWAAEEYEKLSAYDADTPYQPVRVFECHRLDGRVCAGWAGCHDGDELLALRVAVASGYMSVADAVATRDYVSPVPLWESGAVAAAHGLAEVHNPGPAAVRVGRKVSRRVPRGARVRAGVSVREARS